MAVGAADSIKTETPRISAGATSTALISLEEAQVISLKFTFSKIYRADLSVSLVRSLTQGRDHLPLTRSLSHSLTHSPTLTHPLTQPPTHTRSFTRSSLARSLTHPLTRSPTVSLAHSLTHALTIIIIISSSSSSSIVIIIINYLPGSFHHKSGFQRGPALARSLTDSLTHSLTRAHIF